MASKRKSEGSNSTNSSSKRGRKKKENDYQDELSDGGLEDGDGTSTTEQDIEVLIPNEESEPSPKLPEELLETYDKGSGKLLMSGMVTWELTGKRDPKGKVTKVRPNLYAFHRFTDEKVEFRFFFFLRFMHINSGFFYS